MIVSKMTIFRATDEGPRQTHRSMSLVRASVRVAMQSVTYFLIIFNNLKSI